MRKEEDLYKKLPDTPGVYLMKDKRGKIIYVGKAGNLKRRVSSYFLRPGGWKTEKLVSEIAKIDCRKTDTAIEALILESDLIKKYSPVFNSREKDDTSFLFVEVSRDEFPRVLLVRGKSKPEGERFGPFTSATSIREALRIVRKIFPYSVHEPDKIGKFRRACFDYEIGLCPGTCIGVANKKSYLKNLRNIKLFFRGKKEEILKTLEKEMKSASKSLEFEEAAKLRGQIFALDHIQDIAFITEPELPGETSPSRIEGYDISNISGDYAVGSMVVFKGDKPDKNEYRKFKIRTIYGANDTGMLKEVLRRRFNNPWPLPDTILIDGGTGQVNAAKQVMLEFGLKAPVVGIAKGPGRKANRFIGSVPKNIPRRVLIRVRDEAHRFAVSYHKKVRGRSFIGK